jgi:ribosomal protein S18 acetylase RimI-like enzyme
MVGRVRLAIVTDADAIGRVHVAAWQAAYRGQMPDELLDGLDAVARAEMWRERLATGEPGPLVVEDERGDVVGVAHVGPDRQHPGRGELWMLNLAPEAWGTGLGRLLLEAATAHLGALGYAEAVLWVLQGNARARRFYEAAGWYADGTARREDMGGAVITEVRYRCQL